MNVNELRNRALVALRLLGIPQESVIRMNRKDVLRDGAVIGGTARYLPMGVVSLLKAWHSVNAGWQDADDPLFVAMDTNSLGTRISRGTLSRLTRRYNYTTPEWEEIVRKIANG